MKNKSHRYGMNRSGPRYGYKYTKYKKVYQYLLENKRGEKMTGKKSLLNKVH